MLSFRATRLAPSPTGALHLGHARTFLITWWLARQAGAKIYMRMEDLDAGRAKPQSVQQAYDDLHWLGLDWDAYEDTRNAHPETRNEVVQSQRLPLYAAALESLWHTRAIYPCTCTRADIAASVAASASAPHEGESQPRYPGTCRDKLESRNLKLETPHCFRLRVHPGPVAFTDLIAGPQSLDVSAETGDFPITRFTPPPSTAIENQKSKIENPPPPAYQLACVVDDHAMAIDLVIRGDDLLPSTPRQLLLYHALGYAPPRFAHVPLVIGLDGKRLAKRHGESRIAQFRAAGIPPERIVGWAAWRSGQLATPREISARDLLPKFDLAQLPRERVILNDDDLTILTPPKP